MRAVNLIPSGQRSGAPVGAGRSEGAAYAVLGLLVTFGLAMMAEQLLRIIFGAAPLSQTMPQSLKGAVFVGDFLFSRYRLPAVPPPMALKGPPRSTSTV